MKPRRVLLFAFLLLGLIFAARSFFFKQDRNPSFPPSASLQDSPSFEPVLAKTGDSPSPTASVNPLSVQEREQLAVLSEIFQSKNDNDPRLDHFLKNLSEAVKSELVKKYSEIKMEMRNERGTIAFLIARELSEGRGSAKDVEFLKNILMEKPCLSLSDCSKSAHSQSMEEQHLEGIHETTAHYPQLMDLRYLKQSLESGNLSPEMRTAVMAALESARHSPNPRVVQEAQAILDSLKL